MLWSSRGSKEKRSAVPWRGAMQMLLVAVLALSASLAAARYPDDGSTYTYDAPAYTYDAPAHTYDAPAYTYDSPAYTYDHGGDRYYRCRDAAWSRRECQPASHNRIVNSRPDRWAAKSRVRMGNGGWRRLPGGAAELHCLFPVPLLSNVVWTRADRYGGPGPSSRLQWSRPLPGGATLLLERPSPRDAGLYRCLATALHPRAGPVTVFQDVSFQPYF